jgi:uncharacterized protein (TIGR02284 family)
VPLHPHRVAGHIDIRDSYSGTAIAPSISRNCNSVVDTMSNNQIIKILNDLIQTCKAGQDGFRTAAENIPNSEFRRFFNIFSQQRAQFVSELQAEVRRLGGEPVDRGTVTGALHHGVINFRSALSRRDEASIIAECQRGEEAAVSSYQEALKADMPLDVQYVVKRQYMDIKDTFDRIRILQRAA